MTILPTVESAFGGAPTNGNGIVKPVVNKSQVAELDASKVQITLATTLKPVPPPEALKFGQTMTDHMMTVAYDPSTGWGTPEIKPYGPLSVDPAASCFQYATNVFEGMKAYLGPNGEVRLFRPDLNMERMKRSMARVALPPFDTNALIELIKKIVQIEKRWIPTKPGYSLYIRPTIIGTRSSLGVGVSDCALLYVLLCPTGPWLSSGGRAMSLLAVGEHVRSWPGGTGGFKLALNYAPTLLPQQAAAQQGFDQCLWLLGDDKKVTEGGAMNFFVVIKRDDGGLDVMTPPIDGTILPGVTRDSCIALLSAHSAGRIELSHVSAGTKIYVHERILRMRDLMDWAAEGRFMEALCVGTAAIVAGVGRIGFEGKDIDLPDHEGGLGPVSRSLYETITAIQEGRLEWENWSVRVD